MAASVSIELTDEQFRALERLATASGKTPNELAAEAVIEALAADAWFRSEVEQADREADAGDFATKEEVDTVLRKWMHA